MIELKYHSNDYIEPFLIEEEPRESLKALQKRYHDILIHESEIQEELDILQQPYIKTYTVAGRQMKYVDNVLFAKENPQAFRRALRLRELKGTFALKKMQEDIDIKICHINKQVDAAQNEAAKEQS